MKTVIVHKVCVFKRNIFWVFACNVISGLPQSSKRWCSSSSSPLSSGGTEQSSHPKEAAGEQRAVAMEPDVKK